MKSMRDRIFINGTLRDGLLKECDEKNILGMHLMETKDIFLLAVSLGLNTPKNIQGKKDGYFLLKNVKAYDLALFASILLGVPDNKNEIDKYANAEINYDEAERCAESGFEKLKEAINSAGGDKELLEKRTLSELKLLYERNVASNL